MLVVRFATGEEKRSFVGTLSQETAQDRNEIAWKGIFLRIATLGAEDSNTTTREVDLFKQKVCSFTRAKAKTVH